MQKIIRFKPKGMNKDLSKNNFNPEFSYENKNIRISSIEENGLLSIINERGPLEVTVKDSAGKKVSIEGNIIGEAVIENKIILFHKSAEKDYISVINQSYDNEYKYVLEKQFKGNLGFDPSCPIETVVYYEGTTIKKVYWTDGVNQPRLINIGSEKVDIQSTDIDFTPTLKLKESIKIESIESNGVFPSGTIQYAFTYFNKYGAESNIFYTSPIYYIAYINRAASAEDSVNKAFKIDLEDIDESFTNIRIYSIIRTSENSTPICKVVTDLVRNNTKLTFIDNGDLGYSIDPVELLYVGGEHLIAQTISFKDDTMFLGGLEAKVNSIDLDLSNGIIEYVADKKLIGPEYKGFYSYKSNLNKSLDEITTFKYREWYRFGIQAQHESGKWSEPIWINDAQNNTRILNDNSTSEGEDVVNLVTANYTLDKSIVEELLANDYIKVRPVIVYPSMIDRECLCQGVVCPTVYNIGNRVSNLPYVQASWIFRPDFTKNTIQDMIPSQLDDSINLSLATRKNTFDHDLSVALNGKNSDGDIFPYTEIQSLDESPYFPLLSKIDNESNYSDVVDDWIEKNSEYFFVDRSIVTLHSPDIEFDDSMKYLDFNNVQFRIIGVVPIRANYTDVSITTSTPTVTREGYGNGIGETNLDTQYPFNDKNAAVGMVNEFLWKDYSIDTDKKSQIEFPVYLWHREGGLNDFTESFSGTRPSLLDKKKTSILRSSPFTSYNNEVLWTPDNGSNIALFTDTEQSIITIPSQDNSVNNIYYGNIDFISNITTVTYPTKHEFKGNGKPSSLIAERNRSSGYKLWGRLDKDSIPFFTENTYSKEPVRIKYKSTPHAVISFKNITKGVNTSDTDYVVCLPHNREHITNHPSIVNSDNENIIVRNTWNKKKVKVSIKNIDANPEDGFLWLGELYRTNVNNRFGGTTKEALSNNTWLPGGKSVLLVKGMDIPIKWTNGDTYYQRYDCMKTYPYTFEDKNQLTDILSFMCETRVNIDGRYDRNRGNLSNFAVSPANFNLINPVYSQKDNFFTYRITDEFSKNREYPNTITWSKTKKVGESIDTWTNISLGSTIDLDGDKGKLNSIQRFNNQLIAFQDSGISQILYNENTQISTTEGVPIEIANSGKVTGKRYISNSIGCFNKWSICNTSMGIYFMDDINKEIMLFDGNLTSLSKVKGFNSWTHNNSKLTLWNPIEFSNFTVQYDSKNKDVLFIDRDKCLAFSEILGQFTSFYNYEGVTNIINVRGDTLLIKDNKLYQHNKGDYNYFFGDYKPFSIEVIANPEPSIDKIFNTVEFIADTWNNDTLTQGTFNKLYVSNEYQEGECTLDNVKNKPSTLKRKFRIWRANIPRDKNNNRDRIRNPWANIKLERDIEDKSKTILHELAIHYYI